MKKKLPNVENSNTVIGLTSRLSRLLVIMVVIFCTNLVFGQKTWNGSGGNNWNTAANWTPSGVPGATDNVIINTNAAISVNGASFTINSLTIGGAANVSFTSAGAARTITIDNVGSTIGLGSTLTLNGSSGARTMGLLYSGTNLTMAISGNLTVSGTGAGSFYTATNSLTTVSGTLINSSNITSNATNLSFLSGGTYQHARNGSAIPTASWNLASTCSITGITNTILSGLNQTFGNFTWNCAGQTADITNLINAGLNTINGNFNVFATNGFALDLNNSATLKTINVGGNFSISGGILDFESAAGNTVMNLSGNLSVTGTGVLTSSTGTVTTLNGTIVFNGSGIQTVNFTTPDNIVYTNFTVNNGKTLKLLSDVVLNRDTNVAWRGTLLVNTGGNIDCGTFNVATIGANDNAVFTISTGAKMITANPTGVQGSVTTTNVTATYNSGGSYEFQGAATGVFTLTTANTITGTLTFNRSAGVSIDQNFTATTLALTNGVVTTGSNSITIASGGTYTGGSATAYISGILNRIYPSATTLVFPVGKGGNYRPLTYQYTALTGTSTVTVEQIESLLTGTLPASTNTNNTRTWDISQTGGSAFEYKVSLDGTGDTTTGTVVLLKKESGTITSNPATLPNYTNTTAFNTLVGTNKFTLGSACSITSVAGSNLNLCLGIAPTLAANTPAFGTGSWTVTGPSGLSSQFSSTTNPLAVFTPAGGAGTYTLTWAIANGNCSATSNVTLTVGASTTWSSASGGSWNNGAPNATTAAVFTYDYTATANVEACTIYVTNNADVIIPATFDATINGAITVDSGSTFTLENNSNLLQLTTATNTGNIIVRRNSSALKRLDYTMWSSPVTGSQTLLNFSPSTQATRFYSFDTSANIYAATTASGTFSQAKGYLIRMPNNHTTWASVWSAGQFTGVPNNGDIDFTMVNGETPTTTFNAVGNPYPSAISLDDFITSNTLNIDGTIWFWRKTNNDANPTSYSSCTTVGCDITNGHTYSDDNLISVGQGFLVQAKTGRTQVNFTNAIRSSANVNQFFRTGTNDLSRFWLQLSNSNNTVFGRKLIAYLPSGTVGYDDGKDGYSINQTPTALVSVIGDKELVINARPEFSPSDVVTLRFKTDVADTYIITLNQFDGLFDSDQNIFLKDNVMNIVHDLKGSAYTFTSSAGTFDTRFEVVYESALLGIDTPSFTANQVIIYKNNADIAINSGSVIMASVKVFDMRGRLIAEQKAVNASETSIQAGMATEIVLVQITSEDGVVVTKKVVKY